MRQMRSPLSQFRCAGSGSTRHRAARSRRARGVRESRLARLALCHRSKVGLSFHRGAFPPSTMERIMTKISLAVVSAALAIGMVAPASAATTDPEVLVYRFPGVRDDRSGVNSGVATVFHCTNFSGVDETVRFVTRFSSGGLASNAAVTIHHLATRSVSTHLVAAYDNEFSLDTTAVGPALTDPGQGTTAIAATSV